MAAMTLFIAIACLSNPASTLAAGSPVVVIDVVAVFKLHARFNQSMEIMKKDVEVYKAHLRREQQRVAQMEEGARDFSVGSPEYKQLDAQVTKAKADLQVDMALKNREFTEREAKLYFDTYVEITSRVAEYSGQNGVSLVIRYNSKQMDKTDQQSILEGIGNAVIYQQNRDITAQIVALVNQGAMAPLERNTQVPTLPNRR